MDSLIVGSAELTYDPLGGLSNIIYQDGSVLFGHYLKEYDAFMAEKFGKRWQAEKTILRLCHFDAANPPPDRYIVVEGEPGLDPKEYGVVYCCAPGGRCIAIHHADGSILDGMALAEHSAMMKAKFGHVWEANKGKLKARRVDER